MPNPPTNTQQPFPVGHIRDGFPPVMGWAEVVDCSGRSDTSVRLMRASFPNEFPEPIYVLLNTPVYLTEEVQAFMAAHPRIRTRVTPEMVDEMRGLREGGTTYARIADIVGVSLNTVIKHL